MAILFGCGGGGGSSNSSSSLLLNHHRPLLQPICCSPFAALFPLAHRKVARRRRRRKKKKKKNSTTLSISMACAPRDGRRRWRRRSLVLSGISLLPPLFKLGSFASVADTLGEDVPVSKEVEPPESAENPRSSITELHEQEPPVNAFLSLVNAIGILGSGVLGALYTISKEDKAALESTVESMTSLLDAKQAAITSMRKSFEYKMLKEQEEHDKQLKKLKEQQAASYSKLFSATTTISNLDQELRAKKRLLREHQQQLDQLQSRMLEAEKEKEVLEGNIEEKISSISDLHNRVSLLTLEIMDKETSIEALKHRLTDKESEAMNLKSDIEQTNIDCQNANSSLELLKIEVQEELKSKNSEIDELRSKIELLVKERDESRQKFQNLQKEYNDLKTASAAKAKLDTELLSNKDEELQTLEKRHAVVVGDAQKSHDLVKRIIAERNGVKAAIQEEMENVKRLQQELEHTREILEATGSEVSNLSKQLTESESDRKRLEADISRVQSESSEMELVLRQSLDEARSSSSYFSDEVVTVKGTSQKTKEELDRTMDELKRARDDQVTLKRELLEIYKKAESTGKALEETRSTVASLELELRTSFEQLKLGNEAKEALASNLREVTQSLEEMSQRTSSLLRELESARSRTLDLEMENQVLSKSLNDQKRLTLEARDNIEDAQNLLQRLAEEKDSLEKRNANLEGQLAFAKGEILRIRKRLGYGRVSPSNDKGAGEEEAAESNAKKNGGRNSIRRRKGRPPPPSQDSG